MLFLVALVVLTSNTLSVSSDQENYANFIIIDVGNFTGNKINERN